MSPARGTAAALALCALAAAGCGLGPGEEAGSVQLRVTRDYGRDPLLSADHEVNESDTVLRLLDGEAALETRYGGRFVQSIDGLSGGGDAGRRFDWFFYVNGIESPVGAAEFELGDGDRVWWDYRDWSSAMRVPAVVGSYPEPFLHGFRGERWPVAVGCFAAAHSCKWVRTDLRESGIDEVGRASLGSEQGAARILVGAWQRLRRDPAASLLSFGPERSGVFARFAGAGPLLVLLDQEGEQVIRGREGFGLVAAVRPGDGPPTWIVTGTDDGGVAAAAQLFARGLAGTYAIAVHPDEGLVSLPVEEGG